MSAKKRDIRFDLPNMVGMDDTVQNVLNNIQTIRSRVRVAPLPLSTAPRDSNDVSNRHTQQNDSKKVTLRSKFRHSILHFKSSVSDSLQSEQHPVEALDNVWIRSAACSQLENSESTLHPRAF